MTLAQKLYEGVDLENETVGLITYMRTDSVRLSEGFVHDAWIILNPIMVKSIWDVQRQVSGLKMCRMPMKPFVPTSVLRTPESLSAFLKRDELRLYRLIYARAVFQSDGGCQI